MCRATPTPVQTVSGPAPVERRARSGRDEAFSRDLANRTRSFRVPRNPRLVTFGGWGSGSGPEFRTVPLHPWNPKRNKNPPPAYRLGKNTVPGNSEGLRPHAPTLEEGSQPNVSFAPNSKREPSSKIQIKDPNSKLQPLKAKLATKNSNKRLVTPP